MYIHIYIYICLKQRKKTTRILIKVLGGCMVLDHFNENPPSKTISAKGE